MAWKNREKQLASQRAHYLRNKQQRIALSRKRQDEIREYVREFKMGKPCMDCGGSYPSFVMDLDHRDPATKTCDPCQMFRNGWGDARVQAELDKCDIVCANCHRIRTFKVFHPALTQLEETSLLRRVTPVQIEARGTNSEK